MKKLWVPIGLAALVAGLAALQHRWLGQVSDGERDRMRASVRARAEQIAETFDREITRAYFSLQLDPDTRLKRDWAAYAARFEGWRETTAFPGLVSDVLLATREADRSVSLQRFDPAKRTFEASGWPERAAPLRRWLEERTPFMEPIWDDVPAMVLPIPELYTAGRGNVQIATVDAPPAGACILALLDPRYLTEEMLPALVRSQFGSGDALEYDAIVRDREQPDRIVYASDPARASAPDGADATVGLFDLRLETLADMRMAEHNRALQGGGPRRFTFSILQRGPLRMESSGGPRPGSGPRWELAMRHRAGSLEAAVARVRHRNLLLSSSILGLLLVSIGLVLLSARRAERLAAQQVEFVAAVSHELRTPLAVIRSAGENLADGVVADPAQVRRYGTLVREEGQRLTDLVEQVLAYSGIHSPHAAAARVPCAPADIVARAVAESRDAIERAGVRVETDLPEHLPPVLADPAALGRAVANLLTNAIKYGGDARWIGISGRADGREVAITVADRGVGIAPADLARVFDPFYRAASVAASQIHGTGLGLTIVQSIARAHGGRVTVASTPGSGSAFTIHLPAAAGGSPQWADASSSSKTSPASS
jgi:signal transduction histidine kinase